MNKFKYVNVDINKCTGCRVCEYVCSIEHCDVFNPNRSRIRVARVYPHANGAFTCKLCEDHPCVNACPRKGAILQDPDTGIINIVDELCEGCDWCIKACEFGAISLENAKARVCDLCKDRQDGPSCIKWCPEDALELTIDEPLDIQS